MTMKPMAQACNIFMYSTLAYSLPMLTFHVWLGTFVEEVDAVVAEFLELSYDVLLFLLLLSS